MIAIGLDPSLTGFGWAVIVGRTVERCGVWGYEAPGGMEIQTARVIEIREQLIELLRSEIDYRPIRGPEAVSPVVFIESIVIIPNRFMTAMLAGRMHGLAEGVAGALGLKVVEVSASDVKRVANLGRVRKVAKAEVRRAVEQLYPSARELLPDGERGDNASDAIAVAHAGAERLRFASRLSPAWSGP